MKSTLPAALCMVCLCVSSCSSDAPVDNPGGGGEAAAGGSSPSAGATATAGTSASGAGGTRPSGSGGTSPSTSGSAALAGEGGSDASGGMSEGGAGSESSGEAGQPSAGSPAAGDPQLPPIVGECPELKTGTVSVSGLSGISLQVGAKQPGGALVFYWHGTGSSANEVNLLIPSGVRQEILAEGGIIVSFDDSLGTGGDCSGTKTFSKDDFKIADQIAACAVRDHGIDPRRIYTTGCSAGGLQAGCMGAARSSYVAAVVPNSGGQVGQQAIQDPDHVPAVMTMHGGASDKVIVSFATTSAAYDERMSKAGSFVVNCNHGGGHCDAPAALYTAGWEFMKAHPFGVAPEPYDSGLPMSFPDYCAPY
ncbi:MAG: hypothetical protein EOO73_33625 [Myxococcales bacterium]|nr:MAG: hypothetical protein EOO73_33625 [Myxococcales bacterium]